MDAVSQNPGAPSLLLGRIACEHHEIKTNGFVAVASPYDGRVGANSSPDFVPSTLPHHCVDGILDARKIVRNHPSHVLCSLLNV
jgi:hypothetical protein